MGKNPKISLLDMLFFFFQPCLSNENCSIFAGGHQNDPLAPSSSFTGLPLISSIIYVNRLVLINNNSKTCCSAVFLVAL